jgi:diaminopropionate ammonia-lyase
MDRINWQENSHQNYNQNKYSNKLFPSEVSMLAREFHEGIPGFEMTPLKSLRKMAKFIGVKGIWVKDESCRLSLNSFKVLGGSYAIYRFIKKRLGVEDELTYAEINSDETRAKTGVITFATATDGNHGRGVAWAASKLGHKSVIYVHKDTSQPRIEAIRSYGANVKVVDGTYDDAVRQINIDAKKNGWEIISDTSWDGYEEIPTWIMQGYTTIVAEAQEQFSAQGVLYPSHIFVQAGVGALAAAVIGHYHAILGDKSPICIVVEPDEAACLYESMKIGDSKPHNYPGELCTIMAGLACGDPSPIAWDVLAESADMFISVPDYIAAEGMRMYAVPLKGDPFIVSGESGAVTLATLKYIALDPKLKDLKEKLKLNEKSKILLINSEGNTDPLNFRRVVWEGAKPVPHK